MNKLLECKRCSIKFHFEKSSATLRGSFCSNYCEKAAIGYHIDSFLKMNYVIAPPFSAEDKQEAVAANTVEDKAPQDSEDGRDLAYA